MKRATRAFYTGLMLEAPCVLSSRFRALGAQSLEEEQACTVQHQIFTSGLECTSMSQVAMDMDPLAEVNKLVLGTHLGQHEAVQHAKMHKGAGLL